MLSYLKVSFDVLRKNQTLLYLLIIFSMVNIGLAPISILITIYCDKTLNLGAAGIGIIFSTLSIGLFVGSVITSLLECIQKNKFLTITLGILFIAIGFLILGFTSKLYISVIGTFIIGLSISPINIINSSLWQITIEPEMKGRIFAMRRLITRTLDPISIMCFSLLAGYIKINYILVLIGVMIFTTSICSFLNVKIRNIQIDSNM